MVVATRPCLLGWGAGRDEGEAEVLAALEHTGDVLVDGLRNSRPCRGVRRGAAGGRLQHRHPLVLITHVALEIYL